mmetsp:Transcript_23692/g.49192  ORF Transcript_23692/g.49192 Transcript_23692/m.49192 type:complete len:100 (-) Transcript_23692:2240-2539(-)
MRWDDSSRICWLGEMVEISIDSWLYGWVHKTFSGNSLLDQPCYWFIQDIGTICSSIPPAGLYRLDHGWDHDYSKVIFGFLHLHIFGVDSVFGMVFVFNR